MATILQRRVALKVAGLGGSAGQSLADDPFHYLGRGMILTFRDNGYTEAQQDYRVFVIVVSLCCCNLFCLIIENQYFCAINNNFL